jgi:hypothetical protein
MDSKDSYEHILIREATVLVRVPRGTRYVGVDTNPEFFDVRTGVQLREIYPDLQEIELHRGYLLSEESAASVLRSGTPILLDPGADPSKVVTILGVKQRKLDSVVADSILDQVRIISALLQEFLAVAENAQKEQRFWLSQQILTLVRKFSGRELEEIEEILEWFRNLPTRR